VSHGDIVELVPERRPAGGGGKDLLSNEQVLLDGKVAVETDLGGKQGRQGEADTVGRLFFAADERLPHGDYRPAHVGARHTSAPGIVPMIPLWNVSMSATPPDPS
jgi:hypothetical protein